MLTQMLSERLRTTPCQSKQKACNSLGKIPRKKKEEEAGSVGKCTVRPTDATLKLMVQSQNGHGWTTGYFGKWCQHLPLQTPMKPSLCSAIIPTTPEEENTGIKFKACLDS